MFPNGNVTVFCESCHVYSRTNVQIVQGPMQKNSAQCGSGEAIALPIHQQQQTFDMFRIGGVEFCRFKGRMMTGLDRNILAMKNKCKLGQNQSAPESLIYVKQPEVVNSVGFPNTPVGMPADLGSLSTASDLCHFAASIIQRLEISRMKSSKKPRATMDSGCMSSVKKTSLPRCFEFATKRITTFAIPELKQSEIRLLESSHSAYKAL